MKIPGISCDKYGIASIARWLWAAWQGNRLQAILNAALGLASVVVSLLSVWAMQRAIDVASGAVAGDIYRAVGVMGGLVLCGFAIQISRIWVRNILGVRAQNKMQQRLLDRMLRSEWHGRELHHSGDVMNRLEQDVTTVVNFLAETLPNTLSVGALFVGAFAYMFSMDRGLAVVTVAIIPASLLFSKIYVRKMRRLTRKVRDSDSQVQSVMQETVQNRMLIKTLESDSLMMDKLEATQNTLRHNVAKRTAFSVISNLILNFGFALSYLVAFLWAALRMSAHTLSFGGMTAFLQLVNRIQSPARDLSKLIPAFVEVFTAAERLMELEEAPLEEQGDPLPMPSPCGVRLDHVSYTYDDAPVIDDLSFDFRPGTCTAVLGETGSGKTTLLRLLLALIRPQQGEVRIYSDGNDATPVSPLHRCNFVYVPQGNTLMSGTIRHNLLIAAPDATEEMMWRALRTSCAEFVDDLPDKLDTVLGENGAGLSEGQSQRIGIARALLRNRPIMLFDEATSALDLQTERRLLGNILEQNDKTVIFITHRTAVVDYCDATLQL